MIIRTKTSCFRRPAGRAPRPSTSRLVCSHVRIGRIGAPNEIAGGTLYSCSRDGSHLTGAILPMDGRQSVQHGLTLFTE
ncbi:hypothetical protein [Mesorhizobium sp. LNHC229A00]|uniref:hypothetical protein n=1 Tax=Mesorhizobium sp. LNHC229A00 TaxID=1287240 RepID=UPI0003CF3D1D|nr:hypothetical protein [Mesorhizobium sp. LNHC229A00]ESY89544.1 hypothetical protein X741_30535 [Mesorhizobium sp. LNHC229A00]